MSFRPSRKSSKSPRPDCRPPSRNAGIALVTVFWLLLLLSGLAATVAYIARVEALLTHRAFDLVRVQAATDAAIVSTISALSDEQVSRRPDIGTPKDWVFDGIPVKIIVTREAGRIDLNTTGDALLLAFVQSHGVTADSASHLVTELRQAVHIHPLQTVADLKQLPGWGRLDMDCWLGSFTVYSGQREVDTRYATSDVLAAVQWLQAHTPNLPSMPPPESASNRSVPLLTLGEVLRIQASVTHNAFFTASEWVGRATGDAAKPILTMLWQHPTSTELKTSCGG